MNDNSRRDLIRIDGISRLDVLRESFIMAADGKLIHPVKINTRDVLAIV